MWIKGGGEIVQLIFSDLLILQIRWFIFDHVSNWVLVRGVGACKCGKIFLALVFFFLFLFSHRYIPSVGIFLKHE